MKIPEYVSDFKINASKLRSLEGKDVGILKIYPIYRQGWDDIQKKFRSAYAFPARLQDQEVVYSGDPAAKKQEGDTFFYREKFWDDGQKKFGFRVIKNDGAFYKLFKKVCDVDIVFNGTVATQVWDSTLKQNVDVSITPSTVVTMQAFPVSKLIGLIETYDLDANVEMVDGKDKLGNPAKVRPFNWEDSIIPQLVGKVFSFKTRGSGIDTKYTYKEAKDFELQEVSPLASELTEEEMPF